MNHLADFLQAYVLNSLWQVPLVFATAWLSVRFLSGEAAALQHRVWVAALLMECILPACRLPEDLRTRLLLLMRHGHPADASVSVSMGNGSVLHGAPWGATLLWCVAALYGCLLFFFAVRLAYRFLRVIALRRRAQPALLQPWDVAVLRQCCMRLHVEDVKIAASDDTFGPVTLGVTNPMVLLPQRVLTGIPPADLHSVLAHETAHVHRHDFIKNLFYELASLPIAYHPCAWLTRSALVESREEICDAIAADLLTGREQYARSLLRLAEMLVSTPPVRKSHAIGIFDAHAFERRIMKLTVPSFPVPGPRRVITSFACAALALSACGSALALRWNIAAVPAPTLIASASEDHPLVVPSGVMAANALRKVQPVYPPEAKTAKIQGAVVLRAIISKLGTVESLQVQSGPEELRNSAIDAVRQWVYKPYLLNGNPVEVETTITVNYSLGQ